MILAAASAYVCSAFRSGIGLALATATTYRLRLQPPQNFRSGFRELTIPRRTRPNAGALAWREGASSGFARQHALDDPPPQARRALDLESHILQIVERLANEVVGLEAHRQRIERTLHRPNRQHRA